MDAPGRLIGSVSVSGTDPSAAIDCTRYQLGAIGTPGTLTSTSLSFQVSIDGTNYLTLMEVGGASAYTVTVSTSDFVPVNPQVFACAQYVKIVPGSSEGSARTITYVQRPFV